MMLVEEQRSAITVRELDTFRRSAPVLELAVVVVVVMVVVIPVGVLGIFRESARILELLVVVVVMVFAITVGMLGILQGTVRDPRVTLMWIGEERGQGGLEIASSVVFRGILQGSALLWRLLLESVHITP